MATQCAHPPQPARPSPPRLPGPCGGPVSWPARCTPFPITRATRPGRVWPLPCVWALPISCPTPSCACTCTCAACRGSVCQPHGISPRSTVVCVVRHVCQLRLPRTTQLAHVARSMAIAPPDAPIQTRTRSPSDPSHFPRTAPRFPTPPSPGRCSTRIAVCRESPPRHTPRATLCSVATHLTIIHHVPELRRAATHTVARH